METIAGFIVAFVVVGIFGWELIKASIQKIQKTSDERDDTIIARDPILNAKAREKYIDFLEKYNGFKVHEDVFKDLKLKEFDWDRMRLQGLLDKPQQQAFKKLRAMQDSAVDAGEIYRHLSEMFKIMPETPKYSFEKRSTDLAAVRKSGS